MFKHCFYFAAYAAVHLYSFLSPAVVMTLFSLLSVGALVLALLYLNREWIVGVEVPVSTSAWIWLAALWAGLLAVLVGIRVAYLHLLDVGAEGESFFFNALLLAVAYQAIGLWRSQSAIHVGSLILLLVTIGKVFLVDASELEGLFRVLSFLGLGFALIGIGFFYNKVVFARRKADGSR